MRGPVPGRARAGRTMLLHSILRSPAVRLRSRWLCCDQVVSSVSGGLHRICAACSLSRRFWGLFYGLCWLAIVGRRVLSGSARRVVVRESGLFVQHGSGARDCTRALPV